MLAVFRNFMNTWPARGLIIVMVVALAGWGISGVFAGSGLSGDTVATVDGRTIAAQDLDRSVRHDLEQFGGQFGSADQVPPALRRMVAQQTLNRLIVQEAVQARAARMDLVVPDDDLRAAVFAISAFQGANGQFDRAAMNAALGRAGLSEKRFLQLMRDDIAQRELIGSVKAGVQAPGSLVGHVFAYEGETRVADVVRFPFAAVPTPAPPAPPVLQRWYDNHPEDFRTPELRRIKAVVLSPDTIARALDVTDAQLHAAYDARAAQFHQPEKRSVEVVTTAERNRADALVTLWRGGVAWAGIQAAAIHVAGQDRAKAGNVQPGDANAGDARTGDPKAGSAKDTDIKTAPATAVELDDVTADEIPSPELAKAAFAARQGEVVGPIQGSLGWVVLKVEKVTPAVEQGFDSVRERLQADAARDAAAGLVDERVAKLQDALAGGTSFDELPGDLGAAGLQGTLDAQGRTATGELAPLPGTAALHEAIIKAAFAAKVGDAPQVVQGPEQAAFAVSVEQVTPPAPKPYAEVAAQVLADWRADQVRRAQDVASTRLLGAVQGGQSLAEAASIEGVRVVATPPVGRGAPPQGVPPTLARVLFTLKPGEASAVEDTDGFVVAVLKAVQPADQAADPIGFGQMREALSRGMGDDAEITYATALRTLARPKINAAELDRIAQQP